jgi:GNAT superfamily N-acetyltransferase
MDFGPASHEEAVLAHAIIDEHGWGPGPYQGETWRARDGDEVIGVLRLVDAGPDTYIEDVIVREDRRGKGIGSQMMRAAMDSRDGGFYLVCHDERIAFYQRLGYEEVAKEELPELVAAACDSEGDLNTDHDHLHHFMACP